VVVSGSVRLDEVGLSDPPRTARQFPMQLSGGQRQRAALAAALACRSRPLVTGGPPSALVAGAPRLVLS
jgi:peptide/nickel transport system ATP-binding protein